MNYESDCQTGPYVPVDCRGGSVTRPSLTAQRQTRTPYPFSSSSGQYLVPWMVAWMASPCSVSW